MTQIAPLSRHLLLQAPNNRHGICMLPQQALTSLSDVPGIYHVGVPGSISSPWQSASGGIGYDLETAQLAAIGESVERYCATLVQLPLKQRSAVASSSLIPIERWCLFTDEQRADPAFPFTGLYSETTPYTDAYDLQTNRQVWVPQPLVVLRDDYQTGVPTSSGLAAGPTRKHALLRAIQELIERDALMMSWLHGIAARAITMPVDKIAAVAKLHGEVWAFDLTPAYSPFPVIAVAGGIPKRGSWRYSLGVACRESWQQALDKAYQEWNQGVLFAGIYGDLADTSKITDPSALSTFDEHAMYYTLHPEQWHTLPLFAGRNELHDISTPGSEMPVRKALSMVKKALKQHKIDLYYREVTTIDALQLGVRVLRATSPDMANIFAHQQWPLIGKLMERLPTVYPWAAPTGLFPNPMPHPLG